MTSDALNFAIRTGNKIQSLARCCREAEVEASAANRGDERVALGMRLGLSTNFAEKCARF